MKVGDLVKVTWVNPTSREPNIGVLIEFKRYRKSKSEFARVAHTNGHIGTYRSSALEVVSCK
jgi:hypothetical protein